MEWVWVLQIALLCSCTCSCGVGVRAGHTRMFSAAAAAAGVRLLISKPAAFYMHRHALGQAGINAHPHLPVCLQMPAGMAWQKARC